MRVASGRSLSLSLGSGSRGSLSLGLGGGRARRLSGRASALGVLEPRGHVVAAVALVQADLDVLLEVVRADARRVEVRRNALAEVLLDTRCLTGGGAGGYERGVLMLRGCQAQLAQLAQLLDLLGTCREGEDGEGERDGDHCGYWIFTKTKRVFFGSTAGDNLIHSNSSSCTYARSVLYLGNRLEPLGAAAQRGPVLGTRVTITHIGRPSRVPDSRSRVKCSKSRPTATVRDWTLDTGHWRARR